MPEIVSLDPDDKSISPESTIFERATTAGTEDIPKSEGSIQRCNSDDNLRRCNSDSSILSIPAASFKRCITGDSNASATSLKQYISDSPWHDASGDSPRSSTSAVPDILCPMSSTRQEALMIYLPEDLEKMYKIHSVIGQGGYGIVRKGVCNETKKPVAIKTIKFDEIKMSRVYDRECIVAWMCDHPYLVQLYNCFYDDKEMHLVMECLSGYTVNTLVGRRQMQGQPRGLPAEQQERFTWAMLSGIAYLHHHRIAHRDCKPENFMQKSQSLSAPLMMVDFGLAVRCDQNTILTEKVGTPECAAPEVSSGSYNEKCDIWSIGVVSYIICVGFQPFTGKTPVQVMRKARDTEAKFDPDKWGSVKQDLQGIVQQMLVKDPKVRPSAKNIAHQNEAFFDEIRASEWKEDADHAQPKCCTIS